MKLTQSLTTVTRLSKILAAVLFVTLPFVGFYLGMEYQKGITPIISDQSSSQIPIIRISSPVIDQTVDLKTYTNHEYGIEFKYQSEWNLSYFPNTTFLIVLSGKLMNQFPKYPDELHEETILVGIEECFNTQFNMHAPCIIEKNDSYRLDFSYLKSDFIEQRDIKVGDEIGKQTKGIYKNGTDINTYYIGTFFPWNNNNSFQIVSKLYKEEGTLQVYNQILSTFRFLDEPTPNN